MTEAGDRIAVYVHWPYCARVCPYCDFNVVRDRGRTQEQASLVAAILADLEAQAALVGPRPLASIFLGGGTPSLMPPEAVAAVVTRARALFPALSAVEVTLEANPTDAEAGRFEALAAAGVNRLSLGVQALDDSALAFLGRNHGTAEAVRAARIAASVFPRLSLDMIYARPGQTEEDWAAELEAALALQPEHLSPYQLTIEPPTAFGRAVARGAWTPPDEDLAADLYELTQAVLERAGFEAYEVSNHARDEAARSMHNLHVWRGGDYIGVGPGAHGRLTLDGVRTVTIAQRRVGDYAAGVEAGAPWAQRRTLDAAGADEERVLLGLRTIEGVERGLLERLGRGEALATLIDDDFLIETGGRIAATAKGRPVLDGVLRALLA